MCLQFVSSWKSALWKNLHNNKIWKFRRFVYVHHIYLLSVSSSVIQVFTKICKIWRFEIGIAATCCKFLLSFLKSTLDQQLLVFTTSTKAARFTEIWKGKLGNRNITEKNADGGQGWCVFCSELSAKSTIVIDTRVLGRHGMMSGSSGARSPPESSKL